MRIKLNGVMPAILTKSKVIGVTSPVEAGDAKTYGNGFVQGVASVDRNIKVAKIWTGILKQIIENHKHGKLGGEALTLTLQNGGLTIQYNPGYSLPAAARAAAAKAIAGIRNGDITVQP